ncbi:hypothetical protein CEXT_589321 [Caerostris extrusa]|uniref:Uncharacterized protein n=1 Tax=Caerostris extrusa TaxID=172846 RepID=A0AAV4M805_CAEEX|nr:hypothetical protein CEXT_589321 [Caerostris extrusa]
MIGDDQLTIHLYNQSADCLMEDHYSTIHLDQSSYNSPGLPSMCSPGLPSNDSPGIHPTIQFVDQTIHLVDHTLHMDENPFDSPG